MAAIPNFGRAWSVSATPQVQVPNAPATPLVISSQPPPAQSLHVIFKIDTYMLLAFWKAEISIFNLQADTSAAISSGASIPQLGNIGGLSQSQQVMALTASLTMGDAITISAGYLNGPTGAFAPGIGPNLLYSGNLLQSTATRDNVVDRKLTLNCVTGLAATAFGFTNYARSPNQTDWDALQKILNDAGIPLWSVDAASKQAMQNQSYSRGQAGFDRPVPLIQQIANQHNIFSWIDHNGLNMRSFGGGNGPALTPDYTYGPTNLSSYSSGNAATGIIKPTMIGTPQGTQQGVMFRVLMDSQVQIGDVVQLALAPGAGANAFQVTLPGLPPLPNPSGIYLVAGLRHCGDSRGRADDWYTEITGVTPQFFTTYLNIFG